MRACVGEERTEGGREEGEACDVIHLEDERRREGKMEGLCDGRTNERTRTEEK